MPPRPNNHARFVFRCGHPFRPARLHEHGHRIAVLQPHGSIRSQRNHHKVVLRLAEHRPLWLRDTNDLVLALPGANFFSEHIHSRHELVHHIHSDDADVCRMVFIGLRQQPPTRHFDLANVSEGRRSPDDRHVFAQSVSVAHICHVVLLRRNSRCQLHSISQRFVILHVERRPFSRPRPLVEIGNDADLIHHERVRAQVRHFIGHIYIESVQHGYHRHERRDRQDHSQQCEKSPQLVRS